MKLSDLPLEDRPFLTSKDMVYYNTNSHSFMLTKSAFEKVFACLRRENVDLLRLGAVAGGSSGGGTKCWWQTVLALVLELPGGAQVQLGVVFR
jgi:hypothetical protein